MTEPKKTAILVGINEYRHSHGLNYAVQDVESFRDVIQNPLRGKYIPDFVHIYTDDSEDEPDYSNIRRAIRHVTAHSESGDQILFYFAGHGTTHQNGKSYLVPQDGSTDDESTMIEIEWLKSQFESSKASTRVIIMDACHSGLEIGRAESGTMPRQFEDSLARLGDGQGFAVISACKASETSMEDPGLQHGVFSYYFTQGLLGAADYNKDNIITILDAYTFASSSVSEWCRKSMKSQTPTLYSKIAGDVKLIDIPLPKTTPKTTSRALTRVRFTKKSSVYDTTTSEEAYEKLLGKVEADCTKEVRRIGSVIAKRFGAEKISPLGIRHYSFGNGSFGGDINEVKGDDVLKMGYSVGIDLIGNPLYDAKLHKFLIGEIGFDRMEYFFNSTVNMAKYFEFLGQNGYDVEEFDTQFIRANFKDDQLTIRVTQTTTETRILFSSSGGLDEDVILKEIDPLKLQDKLVKLS